VGVTTETLFEVVSAPMTEIVGKIPVLGWVDSAARGPRSLNQEKE
jgi:hypothetical protein